MNLTGRIPLLKDADGRIWEYSKKLSECMNRPYYTLWVGFKTEAITLENAFKSGYTVHEEIKQ